MSAPEAPIYVIVCSRGGGKEAPYDKPIVMETDIEESSIEKARARAASFEMRHRNWGAARIGRVIFEDHPAFNEPPTTKGAL